jgi:uncharacterized UPF0160 family protein
MLKIATHNGIFHADEVTAVALLRVFVDNDVRVTRLPHQYASFNDFDMVIDMGRRYDGKKYFDHHQNRGGKSSAGLIWEYIGKGEAYPKISKFVEMIDRHDTGVHKAGEFEYPNLIRCYNDASDIYGQRQDSAFEEAAAFAERVVRGMKENEEAARKAESIVARSYLFDGNPAIMELAEFTPHWTHYVNGEKTPHIKAVVWEDETTGKWYAKVPPQRPGSFELAAAPFEPDVHMEFVHSAGFLAVAPDEDTMRSYFHRHLKRGR